MPRTTTKEARADGMRDFFVSYTKADVRWATWIAAALERAGYTTHFQIWDFRPGTNFILEMNNAAKFSRRTIAVLSPEYLNSMFASAEWSVALARDPGGRNGTLLPVRVERCELPPSLIPIVYCDLVGLNASAARTALLAAAKQGRAPGRQRNPAFPGSQASPGATARFDTDASAVRTAASELSSVLDTAYQTFKAQVNLRNQLFRHVRDRLRVSDHLEYEAFFHKYFKRMDSEELRLHKIIRGYTLHALGDYNARALEIAKDNPQLRPHIPSYGRLMGHLSIWLTKLQAFKKTPSACLLYAGVEEKAPFPSTIDDELRDFLAGASAIRRPARSARLSRATRAARGTRRSGELS